MNANNKKIANIKLGNNLFVCCDLGHLKLRKQDNVIIKYNDNLHFGAVINITETKMQCKLSKIIRIAGRNDKKRYANNQKFCMCALDLLKSMLTQTKLRIKVIDTYLTFDRKAITFFITASDRLNFKNISCELSELLKVKVYIKYIGARDRARYISSVGLCGRPLCCNKFLKKFESISIHMAKEQKLSLNPMKISGICGHLLCCLKYE